MFYLVSYIMMSVFLLFRMNFSAEPYFKSLWEVAIGSVSKDLMSYLLFWVMFFNLVHIL